MWRRPKNEHSKVRADRAEQALPPEKTLGGRWDRLLVGGIADPERPLKVEPGEWYFGVYCAHCTTPVPIFHDRGRGNLIAIGAGTLTATCKHCGTQGSYGTDSMVSFFIENPGGGGGE